MHILIIVPVLMVAGAVLTYLGINGTPSLPAVNASTLSFAHVSKPALAKVWLPRLGHERPPTITQTPRPAAFDESDVLLSDVLSELLAVRQELAELRARVELLQNTMPTAANASTPSRRARHPSAAETVSPESFQDPQGPFGPFELRPAVEPPGVVTDDLRLSSTGLTRDVESRRALVRGRSAARP